MKKNSIVIYDKTDKLPLLCIEYDKNNISFDVEGNIELHVDFDSEVRNLIYESIRNQIE